MLHFGTRRRLYKLRDLKFRGHCQNNWKMLSSFQIPKLSIDALFTNLWPKFCRKFLALVFAPLFPAVSYHKFPIPNFRLRWRLFVTIPTILKIPGCSTHADFWIQKRAFFSMTFMCVHFQLAYEIVSAVN